LFILIIVVSLCYKALEHINRRNGFFMPHVVDPYLIKHLKLQAAVPYLLSPFTVIKNKQK